METTAQLENEMDVVYNMGLLICHHAQTRPYHATHKERKMCLHLLFPPEGLVSCVSEMSLFCLHLSLNYVTTSVSGLRAISAVLHVTLCYLFMYIEGD